MTNTYTAKYHCIFDDDASMQTFKTALLAFMASHPEVKIIDEFLNETIQSLPTTMTPRPTPTPEPTNTPNPTPTAT